MRKIRTVMATTHVDRHNDRVTLEALQSMREQVRSSYLPFILSHDSRCPPLGRAIDVEIVTLADGEHALVAEIELFEAGPHQLFEAGPHQLDELLPTYVGEVEEAKALGANAVVGVGFSTSYLISRAAEILSYGTAVVVE